MRGDSVHGNLLARAQAMEITASKHREKFVRHPDAYARYLSATGLWYLKAGRWGSSVRATTRAVRMDPLSWRVLSAWLIKPRRSDARICIPLAGRSSKGLRPDAG